MHVCQTSGCGFHTPSETLAHEPSVMDIVSKIAAEHDPVEIEGRVVLRKEAYLRLERELAASKVWGSTRSYVTQDLYLADSVRVRRVNEAEEVTVEVVTKTPVHKVAAFGAHVTVKKEAPCGGGEGARLAEVTHARFSQRKDFATPGFVYTLGLCWSGKDVQDVRRRAAMAAIRTSACWRSRSWTAPTTRTPGGARIQITASC